MSSVQEFKSKRQALPPMLAQDRRKAKGASEEEMALARQVLREKRHRQRQPQEQQDWPFFAKPLGVGDPAPLWWNVPMIGGADGGHRAGQAMATEFLKYLRREPEESFAMNSMAFVVNGMAFNLMKSLGYDWEARSPEEVNPELLSVMAQIGGFCMVMSRWAQAGAKQLGSQLDELTQEDLVRRASEHLGAEVAA